MIRTAVYLTRALDCYTDKVDINLKLDDDKWKQLEILLLILLPFKLCMKWFESNKSELEIDFVFFAYD
jgi:hypothetical protein